MSIWWMYDNHTFKRLSDNIKEAGKQAIMLYNKDNHGSVGIKDEHVSKNNCDDTMIFANGNKREFVRKVKLWIQKELK